MTVRLDDTDVLKDALAELKQHNVVILERAGKPVGALVSLEFLEAIEDASWREEIEEAMADPDEIPWEEVKAKSRSHK